MQRSLGITASITPGNTGQYDVFVGDLKVVGKASGVYPTDQEVVEAVRKAMQV